MKPPRSVENELILGLVSISDRASRGIYDDKGIPTLEAWCRKAIATPIKVHKRLIPDERFDIERTLRELVDIIGCDLILTTGGTGPARRDVTPEATLAVATREMPGFGEQMRAISGHFVPTAILSRQVGVLRETPDHAALIINLPGQPKAIAETLEGLKDESGRSIVNGIFSAVPYCIDLIGGPYIETNESVVKAFRPKSARKPSSVQKTNASAAPMAPAKPEPAAAAARPNPVKPDAPKAPSVSTAAAAAPSAAAPAPEPRGIVVETASTPAAEIRVNCEQSSDAPQPALQKPEPQPLLRQPTAPAPEALKARQPEPPAPAFRQEDLFIATPRTRETPSLAVIWLHGMGVDNRDFAPFPDEILRFGGPVCEFIMPNAPYREMRQHPGYPVRAWYDFPGNRIDDREDESGIRESARRISRLIDEIEARGTPRSRIVLGGFSQGAAIALFTGLRLPKRIGGILALSGYLPLAGKLYAEATRAGRETPILMAHGEFDDVVPIVIATHSAEVVKEVDADLIWRSYPMEHQIEGEEFADIAQFLTILAERQR